METHDANGVPPHPLGAPQVYCLENKGPPPCPSLLIVLFMIMALMDLITVSFLSIGCVLATRFGREARIHVFSNTQKSFLEIPPRSDLIRFINQFLGNMIN